MAFTPKLELPFLVPGQAQKEATINEALQRLDILVQGIVEDGPLDVPPAEPLLGSCYLTGKSATGDWTGTGGAIAAWTEGGWRFVRPQNGLRMVVRSSGLAASYQDGDWRIGVVRASEVKVDGLKVLSSRHAAVPPPKDGNIVDAEARATINAILAALRHHGLVEA